MISRISLPKKLRAELKAHRADLASLLASATKDQAKTTALDKERLRLEKAIETLEAADTLSDAEASKLSMRREQLRRVNSCIAAADDQPASNLAAAEMVELLLQFRPMFQRAMRPVSDAITNEIYRAMSPFFDNSHSFEGIISQSLPMQKLSNFMARQWGLNVQNPVKQSKDAVAIMDALLAGKNPIKL
jgi:hypothetical protein